MDISLGNTTESYIGCSETEFKSQYYNHMQSFKNIQKRNATELFKTFWNAKESDLNLTINWKISIKLSAINQDKNAATCA